MPYEWTPPPPHTDIREWTLHLWPYRSLLRRDFVVFMGATAFLVGLPLIVLVGSPVLWGILPFIALMLWGLWAAISTSYKRGEVLETLSAGENRKLYLTRRAPNGDTLVWEAEAIWAKAHIHPTQGPVEHYITLTGGGREVEVGSFLDPSERKALYGELLDAIRQAATTGQD